MLVSKSLEITYRSHSRVVCEFIVMRLGAMVQLNVNEQEAIERNARNAMIGMQSINILIAWYALNGWKQVFKWLF